MMSDEEKRIYDIIERWVKKSYINSSWCQVYDFNGQVAYYFPADWWPEILTDDYAPNKAKWVYSVEGIKEEFIKLGDIGWGVYYRYSTTGPGVIDECRLLTPKETILIPWRKRNSLRGRWGIIVPIRGIPEFTLAGQLRWYFERQDKWFSKENKKLIEFLEKEGEKR